MLVRIYHQGRNAWVNMDNVLSIEEQVVPDTKQVRVVFALRGDTAVVDNYRVHMCKDTDESNRFIGDIVERMRKRC